MEGHKRGLRPLNQVTKGGFAPLTPRGADTTLSVQDLWVEYRTRRGTVKAVRGVSLDLHRGEALALIGESGSGKTTLGLSLIRLIPRSARIRAGRVIYRRDGQEYDVLSLGSEDLRQFRWKECAMVFQSALNALNPVLKVWNQVYDTASAHRQAYAHQTRRRALDLLRLVQLDPERVLRSYPHELSGGMRQRVLLAMSLLLDPQVLILDEPTTALDVLTQRAIIDVLRRLRKELEFSLILISHDLSLAAELADRVATMYAGAIVEIGDVYETFYRPRHPYTLGLIRAVPTVTGQMRDLASIPGCPPDLVNLPSGCKFHPRCPYADGRCQEEEPELAQVGRGHAAACFHWQQVQHELEVREGA
ncbi:MAG: ABC transporter ATP-binding protein [Chloroflexi bacterium]|nr:ABC transporter ATP-binding protein [Chloroflexota bacterium]